MIKIEKRIEAGKSRFLQSTLSTKEASPERARLARQI
jgi:hypothetical protein